jgi:hypothetical protein
MQVGMALTPNSLARRKPEVQIPSPPPTAALVTSLADRSRGVGAVPDPPVGQQTGSNHEQNGQPLLGCGHETERSGQVLDLPVTSRMLGVELEGRRIQPAHVGYLVDPDGFRRKQSDCLDDHRDDQGPI